MPPHETTHVIENLAADAGRAGRFAGDLLAKRSRPYKSPLAFMASLMPSVNIVSESPTANCRLHC